MQRVNWGIIGLGKIALKFAESFKDIKNAQLVSIASKDTSRLKTFKEKFKIDSDLCFKNYEELLECQKVDIVYIALPNSYHFNWIIKCIEKKKRILVEKPAVVSLNEIVKIKKKLLKKNLLFVEAFMYRFHPQIKKVIELIKKDKIGKLISIESTFGKNIMTKKFLFGLKINKKINSRSRLFNKELGGGSILDLGCYPASFSLLVASLIPNINLEKIKLISKRNEIGPSGIDIEGNIELEFNNEFKCRLSSSFKNDLGKKTIIFGDKGKLIIEDSWHAMQSKIYIEGEENYNIDISYDEDVYSMQIKEISDTIIQNKKEVNFPGMTVNETALNMKILEMWKN